MSVTSGSPVGVRYIDHTPRCPTTLTGRLAWLREVAGGEPIPTALHFEDVEPESVLGSPKATPEFRRYIEKVQTRSGDGRFVYPFRASLLEFSRGGDRPRPFSARVIAEVVRSGYDWERVADRLKWPHESFELFLYGALGLFAGAYTVR